MNRAYNEYMKPVVIAVSAIAIILGGAFLLSRGGDKTSEDTLNTTNNVTIQVESGTVTVTNKDETRSAIQGETLTSPFSITTDASGRATLRFPDGSELRLDHNSTLRIDRAAYKTDTRDLSVSAFLSLGRAWSHIVSLATPGSSWEVETSNVVATVRGTAFDVQASATGTTTVIGSEHNVLLTIRNLETGERYPDYYTILEPDNYVVITNAMAETARAQTESGESTVDPRTLLEQKEKTDGMRNDPWVTENEERDGGDTTQEGSNTVEIGTTGEMDFGIIDSNTPAPLADTLPEPSLNARPLSLSVNPSSPLTGLSGGDASIRLTAILAYSDGKTKDVTGNVTWRLLGPIGIMQGNVFTPRVDESVSEFGRASGSITATWRNVETGAEIFGATPIFEVQSEVIPLIPEG
jgi:hypothetical protein